MIKQNLIGLGVFVALTTYATDFTWTNSGGDADWGNVNNWDQLALPTETDKVIFPVLSGNHTYNVYMNDNRSVKEIEFTADYPKIIGPEYTLSVSSKVTGGLGANLNTLFAPADGVYVQNREGWNKSVILSGGVSAPENTIRFAGTTGHNVMVTGGVYQVSNTVVELRSATFSDTQIKDSLLTIAPFVADGAGNSSFLNFHGPVTCENTTVQTEISGGKMFFVNSNVQDEAIEYRLDYLNHKAGFLYLENQYWGGENKVYIEKFDRAPGAAVKIKYHGKGGSMQVGTNAGIYLVGETNLTAGTYYPWLMDGMYLTKIFDGGYVKGLSQNDYEDAPASTYDPVKPYKQKSDSTITFFEDAEVWAWLIDKEGDIDLNLADSDLTLGSGSFTSWRKGTKTISSTGGKLIFGGEDVILNAMSNNQGDYGELTISAPIAWRKPDYAHCDYPSILFPDNAGFVTRLSGKDYIQEYYGITGFSGENMTRLALDGDNTRTFHGPLAGFFLLSAEGESTTILKGPDLRYNNSTTLLVTNGTATVILENPEVPLLKIYEGGTVIIADGVEISGQKEHRPLLYGGTLCMAGETAKLQEMHDFFGGTIEGGAPKELGIFNCYRMSVKGDAAIRMKIGETSNSLICLSDYISFPLDIPTTLTVKVKDLTGGGRAIRTSDEFTVLEAVNDIRNTNDLSFECASDSKNIDVSGAVVFRDGKTLKVTGLRSTNYTLIMLR